VPGSPVVASSPKNDKLEPMFLDFYQLREQPFGVTPDPRYLYLSPGHRDALASLSYGIETSRGFLSLVAEPGMGKTTLLFQLLQRWRGHVHSAFLFQTQCDSREFIRYLMNDLGLKSDGEDFVQMHSELNEFLFRETLAGRSVVIFIDEAQNLTDTVLETVRLLSDFESAEKKLLQIVLAGQPELAQRLSRPGMAQLRQRIAIQARLDALPAAEVVHYINHRLQVAGYRGTELFTPGALGLIAERSRGIPRLINNLCFNALSLGCATQQKQITSEVIRKAAVDLSLEPRASTHPVPHRQTAVTPSPRPSLQAFYSWITDNLFRRRLFQASVLSLLCGCLVIYFGIRNGAGTFRPFAAIYQDTQTTSAITGSVSRPAESAMDPTADQQPHELLQTDARENSSSSFAYVVQPKDTLRDLCVSTLGRYDRVVLSQIQELNPDLRNPDHLDVGQKILLPLDPLK
jgi:type II secretory pathway predicted ATPase ExeA